MAWFDFFTGEDTEATQKTLDDTDRKLAELNRQKLESGSWSAETYKEATDHLNEGRIDVEAEVNAAAKEGLNEGYDNVTGAIKSTLAAPFNFAFASIPWQVWLAGGAVLFWYMGGAIFIKGIFKKGRR